MNLNHSLIMLIYIYKIIVFSPKRQRKVILHLITIASFRVMNEHSYSVDQHMFACPKQRSTPYYEGLSVCFYPF